MYLMNFVCRITLFKNVTSIDTDMATMVVKHKALSLT